MTLKITADEIFTEEGGARIRTRCPQAHLTDAMVAWAAAYTKLDVGDSIRVQCMTHYKDAVLWQRRYLVASRRNFLKRTENERGDINHQDAFEVRVVAETPWWEVPQPAAAESDEAGPAKAGARKAAA